MSPLAPATLSIGMTPPPGLDPAFPTYPSAFPVADRAPYGYTVDMGVVRSDFAAGNSRQRRAYRVMPHALSLTFHMRVSELTAWQNWANAFAFGWFHCPVSTMFASAPPDGADISFELLRFTSDLSVQMDGWNWLAVSVSAELAPSVFADAPPYGGGGWIVGGTPADPSPDWIIAGAPDWGLPDMIIAGTPEFPATFPPG